MKIVIVGGGFAGIKVALELAKRRGFDVTLISDKDHFTYYPSLYSVATGGSRRQSFVPLDEITRDTGIRVVNDTVQGYDAHRRIVRGEKAEYSFDRVVFALGVVTSYFGIKGLDRYSLGIKSSSEVDRFRRHIHDEIVADKHLDKQYVIVGAGPTGVELSASLASYINHIVASHKVRRTKLRIKLVEAAPRVLPRMSDDASAIVTDRLTRLGVDVMCNETVEWQDDDEVFVSGRSLPTHTVIWTSGVANNPFFAAHTDSFSLSPNKRVVVDEHMMVNDHTYVIGDNAFTPYAGLAQTALHDALYVARDIQNAKLKHPRPVYRVVKPPVVVPVGERWALLEWNWILISGFVGHMIRRAADFIGYHDMLPIGLALTSWRSEHIKEDLCDVCKNKKP